MIFVLSFALKCPKNSNVTIDERVFQRHSTFWIFPLTFELCKQSDRATRQTD